MRLIDADALKEKIVDNSYLIKYDYEFKSVERGMSLTGIQQAIDEMPTVEPKKGRWSGVRYDAELGLFVCDNCGKFSHGCLCRMRIRKGRKRNEQTAAKSIGTDKKLLQQNAMSKVLFWRTL